MAEKYLTVLNKDEIALGYLTNAKGVEVQERLNGEALISFEVPYDTRDATLIEYEGFIKFNGQLYVIKNIEPSENNPRRLVVRAVHVYIELVDEYIDREIELFGGLDGTLQNAVNEVLRDTHFTVGTAISNEVHDFHIYEINALKALQEIAELWNVDVWFDKRTVHVGHRGEYRNAEIRYGKNLKSLSIPTSSENIITRLYIYGKDGLTIEGVNNGVKYLDSPLIGNYKRPKCGEVRFNDIDDPNELMQKGQLHLEKVDKPDVSYSADFIYLSKLGYDVYDEILTGDEIVLTHGPFGIDRLPLRVIEYRYRPFEPGVGSVTLSNTKDSLVDVLVQLAKSKNTVAKALDKNGRIQSNKLDIAIQQATQAMRNAQTELEFPEGLGIIARNVLNSNKFITYNSEGIGFTKDGTTFNQALTHDGLVITKGTVGRLDADVIVIGGGTTYEEGYDPATIADAAVSDFVNSVYANDKATLQNQIDGNITSWFYDYDPTLTNVPALDWITDEMKNNHLGDLFYNSTSGYAWRFALENGVYKWVLLKDTDVTKALQDAQKAQDTADKKRRVFVSQPVPPYDIGDLWSQGTSGELMRCVVSKAEGQTYATTDWEKAVKYTDDTTANEAKNIASKTNVNLIKNGGFEISTANNIPDFWQYGMPTGVSLTRRINDPSWTISGKASLEIVQGVPNGNTGAWVVQNIDLPPIIGQQYTLSAKLGTHRCYGRVSFVFGDAGRTWLSSVTIDKNDVATTPTETRTITCPSGATQMWVEIVKTDTNAGQTSSYLFADEIKVEKSNVATPYVETDLSSADLINNSVQKGQKFDDSVLIGNGNGISVYDAANILRVMLGQYAAGKYGLKVTGGEIYSTTIQTGAEGATTYIKLDPNGDFEAVRNGKRIIFMQASAAEGRLTLYNGSGNDTLALNAVYGLDSAYYSAVRSTSYADGLFLDSGGSSLKVIRSGGINVDLNGYSNELYVAGNIYAYGQLRAYGSKPAIVDTDSFGQRFFYAIESTEVRFVDQGLVSTINGEVKIPLDPVFLEAIETHSEETPWLIRLNKYDDLDLYISEIGNDYFIVKERNGKSGQFTWELSAIRKNYRNVRLEQYGEEDDVLISNWEDELIV